MKNLIRLTDFTSNEIMDIFHLADEINEGNHSEILKEKSAVLFFSKFKHKDKGNI